jgi:1,4-alpha-glucan branching enzyme
MNKLLIKTSKITACMIAILASNLGFGQVVATSPSFPTISDAITITFDAAEGNGGLAGFTGAVYAHTGVITNNSTSPSDWKYTQGTWGTSNAPILTSQGNDKYTLNIANIKTFYGVPTGETVEQIAILFRNEAGDKAGRNSDGSDMFLTIYTGGLFANFTKPTNNAIYQIGETIELESQSSASGDHDIKIDGSSVKSGNGTTVSHSYVAATAGNYDATLSVADGSSIATDTVDFVINPSVQTVAYPIGLKLGINYTSSTSITLGLYAPFKKYIYVIGDFNNWQVDTAYFMKRDPDNSSWHLSIPNLQSDKEYAFQYLVDGEILIADPYSELVVDPNNDKNIDALTYPNPHPYPVGKTTGIATLISMNKTPFTWESTSFEAPKENELIVYELLTRDFVAAHNYQTILDTLDYLEQLGINAIEFMPVNEFEGNESWGYNPSFHMALDKYYGSPESFKSLIDECHKRGIAVILDVVYNHAFSQSPLCQLYWDATNFKPSNQSPYANPDAKHDFNVGYDLNHESPALRAFVKHVMEYWLTEYKVDGFRFDLSKGFTQKNTLGNVGAWGEYDGARVNNIKRIYSEVKAINPNAYVILEHFANNTEEKDLANYGCMFWGNLNHQATEGAMGYTSNFSSSHHVNRGWSNPKLIAYPESHDEERIVYKNLQYGNSSGEYSVKDINTALDRTELTWVIFSAIPGPKMMWQFQELGYDYSIDFNGRVGNKPIRWEYNVASNRKDVYEVFSEMNNLKTTYDAFDGADYGLDLGGKGKRVHLSNTTQNFIVLGNFDVTEIDMVADFQHTGMWYEYFSGDSLDVTDAKMSLTFDAGEYNVWTDKRIKTNFKIGSVRDLESDLDIFPNPSAELVQVSLKNRTIDTIQLVDISGKTVAEFTFDSKSSSRSVKVADLTPGLYTLVVKSGNETVVSKLVR